MDILVSSFENELVPRHEDGNVGEDDGEDEGDRRVDTEDLEHGEEGSSYWKAGGSWAGLLAMRRWEVIGGGEEEGKEAERSRYYIGSLVRFFTDLTTQPLNWTDSATGIDYAIANEANHFAA